MKNTFNYKISENKIFVFKNNNNKLGIDDLLISIEKNNIKEIIFNKESEKKSVQNYFLPDETDELLSKLETIKNRFNTLTLRNLSLQKNHMERIANLLIDSTLNTVDLSYCCFNNDGVEVFTHTLLKNTVEKRFKLDFSKTDFNAEMLTTISSLFSYFDTLRLDSNPIGNDGIKAIIDGIKKYGAHSITTLHLSACNLNNNSISSLANFLRMTDTHINKLFINNNSDNDLKNTINEEGMKALSLYCQSQRGPKILGILHLTHSARLLHILIDAIRKAPNLIECSFSKEQLTTVSSNNILSKKLLNTVSQNDQLIKFAESKVINQVYSKISYEKNQENNRHRFFKKNQDEAHDYFNKALDIVEDPNNPKKQLFDAIKAGNIYKVRNILKRFKINTNVVTPDGCYYTPLHYTLTQDLSENTTIQILHILFSNGFRRVINNRSSKSTGSNTVLHFAVKYQNRKVIDYLLRFNPLREIPNSQGFAPFDSVDMETSAVSADKNAETMNFHVCTKHTP